ncbi:MFS transporter [Rhodococcus sp. BP-252]|uniref:MFS transporter n=1 Tax=unclassified Rhodococcus (in: high G+C Gram-positive bacteria) TaxID=192944 RepID=UPI001431F69C|nr:MULTISPECIES: MFS transporter [unclassified Rhodococcus (in: high G+C Gram-positive bacteria)]MBY6413489.1 MFS transporter [Rhodococcus sp. BP-320]MBY6418183.1 MFS transporter [Rhodococcus sp. BP-321]MBY6422336.1 MFS transporter [Rhodococcus sp. BP-324]MBY6428683.1 MFS transporter [Rhodococcus sp. BP-323]MBY6433689.1 MFS transporter [Rhodococcus sp. BP-322]
MTNVEHPPARSADSVPQSKASSTTARRAAIAGGVGTLIEYYDFAVYGFLAVIIAPLFFPSTSPGVSILATLAVFGVAYVARPLGGIFFGRLGDRRGRRSALVITVVCMGIACGILGLLPTHSSVGILAPILLVVIRLAQGFSAGGEIGGAATYIAESAPPNRRGFFGSFTPIGSTLGFAVAAAVVGLVTLGTTDEQMASWGWRIPFLLALPLAVICLRVRLKLEDSPEFEEMAEKNQVAESPLSDVVKRSPLSVLRVIGIAIAMNGSGYIGLTYFSVYLIKDLGFSKDSVYWTSAIAIALACATFPLSGMLTDRFGRKPVLLAGYLAYVVIALPAFMILGATTSIVVVGIVYFVYMVLNGVVQVPAFPLFTELFPRAVRYTGVSLGFNIGTIAAGGTAPYVAAQLVESTGNAMSPAYWVMGVCAVGVATVLTIRETGKKSLPV